MYCEASQFHSGSLTLPLFLNIYCRSDAGFTWAGTQPQANASIATAATNSGCGIWGWRSGRSAFIEGARLGLSTLCLGTQLHHVNQVFLSSNFNLQSWAKNCAVSSAQIWLWWYINSVATRPNWLCHFVAEPGEGMNCEGRCKEGKYCSRVMVTLILLLQWLVTKKVKPLQGQCLLMLLRPRFG